MVESKPKVHSIKYNALMNVILTTSGMLFPLITVPYVSRALSTYGLGAVSFAQSVMSYFLLVAQFGITLYGVRTCAQVRDNRVALSKVVKELLCFLAFTVGLTFAAYVGAFFLVPRFQQEPMLHLMFGLVIWLGSFGVEWFYQALEQYDYITVRSLVFKAVGLVLMFVFVRGSDDYLMYAWIVILSGYGSNVVNMLRLRKFCDFSAHEPLRPFCHLKKMAWFAVASSSSNMYTQTDIILLGFLSTNSMVGVYQIVSKIESVLKSAVNSVGNVLLPRMSYYTSHGREEELKRLMATTVNFIAVASTFLIAVCTICSREIVEILGGENFADAALPLIANGPAVFFAATNIPLASYLVAREGEKKWAMANLISLVVSYAVGIPLVSLFGMLGAGVGISITEGIGMALRSWFCKNLFCGIWKELDIQKAFLSGLLSGLLVWYAGRILLADAGLIASLLVKGLMLGSIYLLLLCVFHEKFAFGIVDRYVLSRLKRRER